MKTELTRFNERKVLPSALESCALLIVLVCAMLLCYTSLTTTCRIDPLHYEAQHIQSMDDGKLFNIVVTLGACILLRLLFIPSFTRRFVYVTVCILLPLLAIIGVYWVLAAKAVPMSDAGILYRTAMTLAGEEGGIPLVSLSDQTSYEFFYFVRFPFQFGFLSYMELMVRLFGAQGALAAVPILNVVYLVCAYSALICTTEKLFSNPRVTLLTTLFLCACMQPFLACTWMYGLIPAFTGSAFAILFTVCFLQSEKKRWLAAAALASALAVFMKPNAWIPVAAIGIVLVLSALRRRRWQHAAAALLIAAACIPLPKLAQASYEARIGAEFGKGYPMSSWMAMGMREGAMACGWYNGYSQALYKAYGMDISAADSRARQDIAESLQGFAADSDYTRFFYNEKLSSQWNEPTFMSIWVSAVCEPYGERGALIQDMYGFDGLGGKFAWAENYFLQLLYTGFAFSALRMLFHKKERRLIYPLTILGGVLFHLLFEANAKYTLSYLPLFCPLAAYGILTFGRGLIRPLKEWRGRREYAGKTPVQ